MSQALKAYCEIGFRGIISPDLLYAVGYMRGLLEAVNKRKS